MRTALCLVTALAGALAWAGPPDPTTAPAARAAAATAPYNYRDDLPRVAIVVAPADGAALNPASDDPSAAPNRVEIHRAAGEPVAYSVVPVELDPARRAMVFDHTGGTPKKAATLALVSRQKGGGVVVELTRGLFGLDNPWCATAVGDHPVVVVKGPGNEIPVTTDACVDLFTPPAIGVSP